MQTRMIMMAWMALSGNKIVAAIIFRNSGIWKRRPHRRVRHTPRDANVKWAGPVLVEAIVNGTASTTTTTKQLLVGSARRIVHAGILVNVDRLQVLRGGS